MRKTLRALVAVISILVAVMAVILFVYRLGEARTTGERSSGAEYSILRNALMSVQNSNDFQDQFLRERLIAFYKGSDRLLAAQVLDASGFAVWKLPSGSAYFALPNDTSMRAGYSAPQWSTVVFTTPLSDGMKLTALYVTVYRSDISWAAKIPLIVAGIWCLVVALLILLFGRNRKESILPEKLDTSAPPISDTEASDNNMPLSDISASVASDESDQPAFGTAPPIPEPAAGSDRLEAKEAAVNEPKSVDAAREAIPAPPPTMADTAKPAVHASALGGAARSDRNFEESLAKLEEEIVEWSSRHPEQISPLPKSAEVRNTKEELASPTVRPQDELDEELREELDEIETAPEDEPDQDNETDLADSRETLQEFEELNAENSVEKPKETEPALGNFQIPAASANSFASPEAANERPDLANLPMPLALTDAQLEARLDEELNRNTKSELSLMLIHCAVSSRTDPAAVALAVTIKDYIGSKDLVFELYKGAFAVVLPSVDLGGALKMSEDLADVLSATLCLYKDIEGEAPVFIGISARADRKVDAYKIYREASTAVHKAYAGGHSRILAFRPKVE